MTSSIWQWLGSGAVRLPRLLPQGQHFTLETGGRFTAIGHSDFHLLGRFLSREDIAPVLRQREAAGFNLLRVWTRYQLAQYGIGDCTLAMHPDLYARLPEFLRACAGHGFYVELTAYTGREDYDAAHWERLCDVVRDEPNVLLELVNENDQAGNRIATTEFHPPAGIPSSHGSNGGGQAPVAPYWQYATFHTNGQFEEQRKVGHNAMEIWDGPTLTNETSRYPDVGMWLGSGPERTAQLAFDAAAGAALLCAGSVFHDVHGKDSTLWDADAQAVATAWAAGARSVPLACQDGPYTHRPDLEGAGILRAYERPVPGVEHVVLIRE